MQLTQDGKEEFALAILLWKDFKSEGKMDLDIFQYALKMCEYIGCKEEFEKLMSKLPPMKILPRYP
jgi:hypothetical protein